MESKVQAYTNVRNAIHGMLERGDLVRGSSTEHSLSILEQKWTSVYNKVQERKVINPIKCHVKENYFFNAILSGILVLDYTFIKEQFFARRLSLRRD